MSTLHQLPYRPTPAPQPAGLRSLWNRTLPLQFARGDYLFLPGDPARSVFLVRSGALRVARLLDGGGELTLDIAGPGDLVGEGAVLGEASRATVAQAVSRLRISPLPVAGLRSALSHEPGLALELAGELSRREARLGARAAINSYGDCQQRIAALLLEMTERFGESEADGIAIGVRLTHEEVARFVGAARETVTPLLGQLRSLGLIDYDRRRVLVRDEAALQRLKRAPRSRSAPFPSA